MSQSKKTSTEKTGAKVAAPVVTVAQELNVDTDLRRLYEACGELGDYIVPFAKRIKGELARVKDGDQDGVPVVPLFIRDPISFKEAQLLFGLVLPPYPYLREIKLHHCNLGDDGVLVLTEFLRTYKPAPEKNPFGVECLELPGCSVGPRGAGYLGKLLSENHTVKRVVLDFNSGITDDGVAVFCSGLRWNNALREVSLQYCNIGAVGAAHVASGIIKSSNVATLSLRGNPIRDEGIVEIGGALSVGTNLSSIDLADTCFGARAETVEVLCSGIEGSASLSSVNLDLNTLATAGAASVLSSIQKNKKITSVVISERTDAAVYKAILDAVTENCRSQMKAGKRKGKK